MAHLARSIDLLHPRAVTTWPGCGPDP